MNMIPKDFGLHNIALQQPLVFSLSLQKIEDMLTKANVIKTITGLPDHFSIDDLVDKMILLDKIEKGIQQADKGKVISDKELDRKIDEWLK
ncbi:MAG: hypothetical protein WC865_13245 [Bacteroidales bacterium]